MRLLEDRGIPYENIDIDRDPEGEAHVMAWNDGNRSVPTIVVQLILVEPANHVLDSVVLAPQAILDSCVMYLTTWCPDCHRSQAWFKAHSLPVTEINIEQVEGAADTVQTFSGGMRSMPTIDLHLRITEPSNSALERLLGLAL